MYPNALRDYLNASELAVRFMTLPYRAAYMMMVASTKPFLEGFRAPSRADTAIQEIRESQFGNRQVIMLHPRFGR
jgi:hypothetical protein